MTKLILAGSGEFTPVMEPIDKKLLEFTKNNVVAIIPLAAGLEPNYQKWIEDGIKHFKKLGAEPIGLDIINRKRANDQKFIKNIQKASIVYFSGGNPGYLFESLKRTLLWKEIYQLFQKEKIILAGSSAGAMIMGNYVLANAVSSFEKNEKPRWIKSFGLTKYSIVPHYDYIKKENPKRLVELIEEAPEKEWIGIDENTVLIIDDSKNVNVEGKGKVQVVNDGKLKVYSSGDKFQF
ncbi:MAG TPA: Type 1 glutamine amidotransferase-like domain-containing protein [Patescibacteria group bacterium]